MVSNVNNDLLTCFFSGIECGDVDQVINCYAEKAQIWHNFDQITTSPAENAAALRDLFDAFPIRRYDNVRRSIFADGAVQQHVFHLERADGKIVDWPACIIFTIDGSKIVKLEEYLDMKGFMEAMT